MGNVHFRRGDTENKLDKAGPYRPSKCPSLDKDGSELREPRDSSSGKNQCHDNLIRLYLNPYAEVLTMKNSKNSGGPEDLRTRAEESLKSQPDRPDDICLREANCLIHELRVHQVELEMQNEELRRVQNDLEVSRSRYSDLYDFAPVGYLTLKKNGQILELNLTAARKLGVERGHLVNAHFQNYIFPPDKKVFFSHLKAIFDKRQRQISEVRLSPKGGELFYARIESIYLEEENGTGLCRANISDVTLLKLAEQVLQNAHAELERLVEERTGELTKSNELLKISGEKLVRSNEELQDFAFIASHDMQEPLRKIRTFANRLKEKHGENLDSQGREFLERMNNSAKRMSEMVKGLLDYSRVGNESNLFTLTDLTRIITEVVSDLDVLIANTGGRVEVGDLPTLEVDPIQMRQLFQNLIVNSLKFRGEEKPLIKIYTQPVAADQEIAENIHGKTYQIFVEDNGIGFDEQFLDRIFTMFQRLNGRSSYEGCGIGLSICRRIVEHHGGSITARSKLGAGSTFIATLPANPLRGACYNLFFDRYAIHVLRH